MRLRRFTRSARRQALVALAVTSDVAAHHKFAPRRWTVADEQVALAHLALLELLAQRLVRQWRLAEDQHAAGLLVEPVDDGEVRPARLAVAEPVVDALAGVRGRSVGVPAGGFVHHQQMVVFKQDAGRKHARFRPGRFRRGRTAGGRGLAHRRRNSSRRAPDFSKTTLSFSICVSVAPSIRSPRVMVLPFTSTVTFFLPLIMP